MQNESQVTEKILMMLQCLIQISHTKNISIIVITLQEYQHSKIFQMI